MTGIRALLSRPTAVAAAAVLVLVAVVVAIGGALAPHDPLAQNTANALAGPSQAHWLGTDYLGRDTFSRLLAGARLSVLAAAEAVVVALVLGASSALAAVFGPRWLTWTLERIFDSFMALPFITFAVAVGALLGNGVHAAMLAVGILAAPSYFRVVRSVVLAIAHTPFVEAAQLFGVGTVRIVCEHVLPRIVPVLVVTSAGVLAGSLLVVASLTFLGVGVQPPTPTWGGMLAADLSYLTVRPLSPLAPAIAIMVTVAALGLLADHIRDLSSGAVPEGGHGAGARDEGPGADGGVVAGGDVDEAVLRHPVAGDPDDGTGALVSVDDLHVSAEDGTPLVRGISLQVPRGASVGVLGESGSGKTMTCRALLGALPHGVSPTAGTIRFDDARLFPSTDPQPWRSLWGRRIGTVFQDPAAWLSPHLTVGSQVDEALRTSLPLSRTEARARRLELFAHVGLRDPERVSAQYVHELSGGMLQRILLAIAVSGEPDLLIADEPTTALDVTVQAEVLGLIGRLREEHALTVLMISHDLAVLAHSCEHLYVLRHGRVVESGPTAEVLTDPRHPYTRSLVADHAHFDIDDVRAADRRVPERNEADEARTQEAART